MDDKMRSIDNTAQFARILLGIAMLHITPSAAEQIKILLAESKSPIPNGGLRITVEGGGCSGMQYAMSFESRKADDQVFHEHDVDVLVDPASLVFIDGSTIDYVGGLTGAGFKIMNPKAKQTCGCGTSFEA
jgi:iron-sulfur cluster assembly accessory protein